MSSSIHYIGEESSAELSDEISNPFHLETCAAYMFHKILSNSQYGIGNILSSSIKNFKASYEDP